MMRDRPTCPRPVSILKEITEDLELRPAWHAVDEVRAQRARLEHWPSWCFCPTMYLAAPLAQAAPLSMLEMTKATMLAGWRPTQGIYRFHTALLETLWKAKPEGELNPERFAGLPEWCVYIEIGRTAHVPAIGPPFDYLHGMFVGLNIDWWDGAPQLQFLLDFTNVMLPESVRMVGTIDESLHIGEVNYREFLATQDGPLGELDIDFPRQRRLMPSLVSLVLELCSSDVTIRASDGSDRQPRRPTPRAASRRKGRSRRRVPRLVAAESATIWDVHIAGSL